MAFEIYKLMSLFIYAFTVYVDGSSLIWQIHCRKILNTLEA